MSRKRVFSFFLDHAAEGIYFRQSLILATQRACALRLSRTNNVVPNARPLKNEKGLTIRKTVNPR